MSTDYVSQLIPLEQIFPSETNPRKFFDQAKLEELAASIKVHGVLEPLLVERRAVAQNLKRGTKTLPTFEIVAGERRYRAAQLAGLKEVPAIVHCLTVAQSLEIKLIENLQREDLDPVEEAMGIQQLLDAEVPAAEIAAKLGKSKAHVYGCLKLLNVPQGEGLEALKSGKLSRNHGILIGRIPSEKLRAKAVNAFLHPEGWQYQHHAGLAGQVLSFREAKEWVEKECMVELKGAPFDRKALDLVPAAGSCEACPKRTGNNPEEYADARADVCTDPECFRKKAAAAKAKQAAKLNDSGVKVLSNAAAKKALNTADFRSDSEYVTLKKQIWHDPKKRSLKQLVGEELKAETVAAIDERGETHLLVLRSRADEILKEKGLGSINGAADRNGSRDEFDWKKQNAIRSRFLERFIEFAYFELKTMTSTLIGLGPGPLEDLLLDMIPLMTPVDDDILKVFGVDFNQENPDQKIKEVITTGRQAFLAMLLCDIHTRLWHLSGPEDTCVKQFAKRFGIDAKALWKKAKEEIEVEGKAPEAKKPIESLKMGAREKRRRGCIKT